jgi:hypothetical protein
VGCMNQWSDSYLESQEKDIVERSRMEREHDFTWEA